MIKTMVSIDDDFDIIEPVFYPLRKTGYRIINISTIEESIEKVSVLRNADLIFLDLFFPPVTEKKSYPGLELLKTLRFDYNINTSVVVFSVIGDRSKLNGSFRDLGVKYILSKPISSSKLLKFVEKFFSEQLLRENKKDNNPNSSYLKSQKAMRYNPNLAKKILEKIETFTPKNDGNVSIDGYSPDEISYHIKKLHEDGLIKGINAETFGGIEWLATELTSQGHKFLKRIRENETNNLTEVEIMEKQTDSKIVFVVHGRNSKARKSLFQFLRSIGLHPLEWSEAVEKTGQASPYVGEVLEKAFSIAQAAIILFTPDDEARLREEYRGSKEPVYETELTGQARPNVIFEAGMAMGMFPDRTVLVELGELRPISDIGGRHVIRMNNNVSRRQELAQRLKTAGCIVNLSGTDWHDEGDFSTELFNPKKKAVAKTTAFESNTEENAEKVLIRVKNTIYALENFHSNPEGIYYIGQTILECESFLEELGQLEPVEGVIFEIINEIDNDTRKDEGLFDPIISISKVRKIIKHLKQIRLDLLNGNVET